jgi:hypothetical protein
MPTSRWNNRCPTILSYGQCDAQRNGATTMQTTGTLSPRAWYRHCFFKRICEVEEHSQIEMQNPYRQEKKIPKVMTVGFVNTDLLNARTSWPSQLVPITPSPSAPQELQDENRHWRWSPSSNWRWYTWRGPQGTTAAIYTKKALSTTAGKENKSVGSRLRPRKPLAVRVSFPARFHSLTVGRETQITLMAGNETKK